VVIPEMCSIGEHRYIQVSRYDRSIDDAGRVIRLHQEDFCQALGLGSERKYEEYGGPTFADCYDVVLGASSEPVLDVQHILGWQIFNVLAGNADGHARNLSLLYGRDGTVRLAPFYDLVCTRAIDGIDHRLALFVGEERDAGNLTHADWRRLAEACDMREAFVLDRVREMRDRLSESVGTVRDAFEAEYGPYPALQRVESTVRSLCRRQKDI